MNSFILKRFFLLKGLLLIFGWSSCLFAQDPDRGISMPEATFSSEFRKGKNYLFVVGIDKYQKWLKLRNAVNDAEGIVKLLTENFGFTLPVPPLYDEQATRKNIEESLEKVRRSLTKDDNLVIFFAGHGHTRTDTIGGKLAVESGYLIPVDGAGWEEDRLNTYIKIDHLLNLFSLYPARHVTVILDACHSGLALGVEAEAFRSAVKYAENLESKISRRVLTSARAEQLASDVGPLPNHSLFTGTMIEGLLTGRADIDQNGLITTSELGLHLEQEVSENSNGKQIPDFGSFDLDDRGEMILELNSNSPAYLITNAYNQLENGNVRGFIKTYQRIEQLKLPIEQTSDLSYRYNILIRKIDKALEALTARFESSKNGQFPLSQVEEEGLAEKIPSLRHWADILESPNLDPDSIQIELFDRDTAKINPVHLDTLAVECNLPNNTVYTFRITNKSSEPIFPYALFIDESGDLFPLLLLPFNKKFPQNERIYREGLQPGESTFIAPLRHEYGNKWFVDVKFYFTNQTFNHLVLSPVYVHMETYTEVLERPEDMVSRTFRLIFK